jgi:hypothetical protein
VANVVYGRNEVIGTLIYKLKPGRYFRSSDTWKSFFDQHRFCYVLKGESAVQDPHAGEIALAQAGRAVHWRGAKWHFGYNFKFQRIPRHDDRSSRRCNQRLLAAVDGEIAADR